MYVSSIANTVNMQFLDQLFAIGSIPLQDGRPYEVRPVYCFGKLALVHTFVGHTKGYIFVAHTKGYMFVAPTKRYTFVARTNGYTYKYRLVEGTAL